MPSPRPAPKKIRVVYVTSSDFKIEENKVFSQTCTLNGAPVGDLFEFDIRKVPIAEMLEVDLRVMVKEEVKRAYAAVQVPCIVEHAGLIFSDYEDGWYPGGLTKPMWNTLGDAFLKETNSAGRRAIACAVVAYCDGKQTQTFEGRTSGVLAKKPRGNRKFYWDTVFVPDDPTGKARGKTYAQICEDTGLGVEYKIQHLSQSARAMTNFLAYLLDHPPELWKWA